VLYNEIAFQQKYFKDTQVTQRGTAHKKKYLTGTQITAHKKKYLTGTQMTQRGTAQNRNISQVPE
jgi:hypothetical protein